MNLSKKLLILAILSINIATFSFADTTETVNNILKSIEISNANKTDLEKKQSFELYIPKIQRLSSVDKTVRGALEKYLKAKIEEIKKSSTTTIYASNITNINKSAIDEAWLQRHNTERQSLGLSSYTLDSQLNNTAQNRANYLAKINGTTHRRLSTDGYYNYNSIKSRFKDQGVTFPSEKNGVQSFTENLAYQYTTCNKSDCTNEIIVALKKCFGFFMAEKGRSYKPHYNAIASSNFTQIGYGISKVGSKIFIVTHYAVDF